ncbi:the CD36 [Porites harrisoni]
MPSETSKGSCCCSRTIWIICLAVCGVVFLVSGLVFSVGGVFSNIINQQVDKNVELKPGSFVYEEWKNFSTPIYMKYYVFNVTNHDEVMDGAIPNVTQIGPYSYRELRFNEVLNWSSDHSIVTFMPNRTYIFDPETSCDGCDDKNDSFFTVNIPLLSVALWLRNSDYRHREKHLWCLPGVKGEAYKLKVHLFQRKTVSDILWGYTDPFLDFLKKPHLGCQGKKGLSSFVQLQYNNTYYGISAVHTGQDFISKLDQFTMWRGQTNLTWWSDKYANMINGTEGTQFAPRLSKDVTLYAFSPEICRSVYFNYESTVTVKGIKLYRFIAPDELYLSGDIYPPNKGFCVPPRCLPTGLLNVSLCQPQNPPVALSPPHFYQGNKSLVEAVHGLNPQKSLHETFADIEPITGIVMRVAKRVQINVALEPVSILDQTKGKFKPVFLPVMFACETAVISDEKAEEFKRKVYRGIFLTQVAEYFLIALGSLCIVVAIVLVVISVPHKKYLGLSIQADDSEKRTLITQGGNKVYT